MERLTYDRAAHAVTYRSDKSEGPTAGTETVDPLEFLARVLVHIPTRGTLTTRYYGWYANRPRGMRLKATPARRRAARDRACASPRADRGGPPMGVAPAADLRGRPTRVSHLPRRDARRGVHYAVVGHRPDPHPPPHARRACAPPRRPEPAIDAAPASRSPARAARLAADAPSPG
ncbi:MAG: transposase [Gemmatimonadetes bacterium]|nr:transposase [Gemmatimonadota bacterium]